MSYGPMRFHVHRALVYIFNHHSIVLGFSHFHLLHERNHWGGVRTPSNLDGPPNFLRSFLMNVIMSPTAPNWVDLSNFFL